MTMAAIKRFCPPSSREACPSPADRRWRSAFFGCVSEEYRDFLPRRPDVRVSQWRKKHRTESLRTTAVTKRGI